MRRSITWRMVILYSLLFGITIAGTALHLSIRIRDVALENWQENLLEEARMIADRFGADVTNPVLREYLQEQTIRYAHSLKVRITLIGLDGVVLAESDAVPDEMENHLQRPEVQQALNSGIGSNIRYSVTLQQKMLYVAVLMKDGANPTGIARLAISLENIERSLSQTNRVILLVSVLAVALVILVSILLARYITRPLFQLTRAVQRLTSGEDSRLPSPAKLDEVGQLNLAFQSMASTLRERIDELQNQRVTLESVLVNLTDGVMITDKEGKILLINPAAARMFKIEQKEAMEHSLVEVVRHYQLVEVWNKCRSSGEQQFVTLETTPDRLFVQVVATHLSPNLPGNYLLVFQDLTRLRRLETVRRDFISNVSHELRTPLASLKALAETLNEGALEDPPAARRFLGQMETEIDNLTQMVRELLELSRIESGRVPLNRVRTAPNRLVASAVDRMRLQAERAGLKLLPDCSDELPAVRADSDRIEQVLVNLIHNAIKFTPPGGEITVSARQEGRMVVFGVRDTGVGIAPEDLPRIFERFYKADRARSGGGTGLGLSIARHLIEGHGGTIWAQSVPGQGSTFSFSLPVD
ncbi:MAG TPA: ATP-binding protein [Anaerolineaceae bacterium]